MMRPRPTLSPEFTVCTRAYGADVLASIILFVAVSVLAGRVWRFPFDDEVYTLALFGHYSAFGLLTVYPATWDVHPPLSYLLFYGLQQLGLGEAGLRLCSLAMTALALALFQLLALTLIGARKQEIPPATRVIAVLLFALAPLAVSQGDAIRWYPLFAVLIASFVTLYLAAGSEAVRLSSALPLGLAASTNFLAAPVVLAFALYRYGLQRRFQPAVDLPFWLLVALFGSLGIYTAYVIVAHHIAVVATQLIGSPVQAALTDVLGFFGGDALGVGQAWAVVPAVVIAAVAMLMIIDRKRPADPVHLLLLMLAATVPMVLAGFAKPRSFLYLAPVMAAVLTLFLDRQAGRRGAGVALLLASMILMANVGAIANINGGTHPFKRNSVIPYAKVVDFIRSNQSGRTLVASTDPVIVWVLQHRLDRTDRCAGYFFGVARCLAPARRYDSIFVITGHSDKSAQVRRRFDETIGQVIAGRQKVVTIHAGLDEDAAWKSRLTGVALDRHILTIDLYR